ncbi:hypothetical protein BT63DRAFT_368312 [Microthyrium microscopicum]|uniref:WW domain-containing protein n=1 Tax=Microthyrium microscopicum TaxID=703497 RepID=A0A6A6UMB4_9PEZI|nr:hypothetical protein BT63DRAFT_368312 [Microthyrium microscopicum]
MTSSSSTPLTPDGVDPIYTNSTLDGTFGSLFPFSVGLNGVDQDRNYLAIQIMGTLLAIALAFTLIARWTHMFVNWNRLMAILSNPERQNYWKQNGNNWFPWLKKHIIYAPLWKKRHNEEISLSKAVNVGTLPGRNHSILLFIYGVFTIVWTLTLPYDKPSREVIASLRGRSGLIAVFNLFPTIVFALRNNPLIWVIHVSYDTFQLFHRWAARIFIIEALIHALSWVGNTREAGGWTAVRIGLSEGPHAASYAWGLVSTFAGFIILFQAWSPIRHAFYETFLFLHKTLVFLVLLGTLLHLKLDNLPQSMWLVAVFILWGYDYAMRFYRIYKYNISIRRRKWSSRVTVEAFETEACRVTFHLNGYWKARPGTHVHAYLPQFAHLQSHPFSVAWSERYDLNQRSEKLPSTTQDTEWEDPKFDHKPEWRSTVSLICRARTGFTRDLWEKVHLLANPKDDRKIVETWGYVEGFYSGHENLSSYGDVVLFAGGVGITHQLMFCKQLIDGFNQGTVATQRITLVWAIPSEKNLKWIVPWMNDILSMENRPNLLDIKIYVTRSTRAPGRNPAEKSKSGKVQVFHQERAKADEIMKEVIRTRKGAVAVTVCGPGVFADAVRDAVRWQVDKGLIDFIEEAFTY